MGGGTLWASLLPKNNPGQMVADGMEVTTSFLGCLSSREEVRGALDVCVLTCKSTLRTGKESEESIPEGTALQPLPMGISPDTDFYRGEFQRREKRPW